MVVATLSTFFFATDVRSDAFAKLELKKLEAVHRAIVALMPEWKVLPRVGPYREHRANLHVHSHWLTFYLTSPLMKPNRPFLWSLTLFQCLLFNGIGDAIVAAIIEADKALVPAKLATGA